MKGARRQVRKLHIGDGERGRPAGHRWSTSPGSEQVARAQRGSDCSPRATSGSPGCRQQVSGPCRAAPLGAFRVPLTWEAVGLRKLGSGGVCPHGLFTGTKGASGTQAQCLKQQRRMYPSAPHNQSHTSRPRLQVMAQCQGKTSNVVSPPNFQSLFLPIQSIGEGGTCEKSHISRCKPVIGIPANRSAKPGN